MESQVQREEKSAEAGGPAAAAAAIKGNGNGNGNNNNNNQPQQQMHVNINMNMIAPNDDSHDINSKTKLKSTNKRRCSSATTTASASASAPGAVTIISDSSEKESLLSSSNQQKRKKRRKKYYYNNNVIVYCDDNNTNSNSRSHQNSKQRRRNRMNELFSGIFIYAICVSAPVIFGIVVKWYENYFVSQSHRGGVGTGGAENAFYEDYYAYDDDNNNDHHYKDGESILRPHAQRHDYGSGSGRGTASSTTTGTGVGGMPTYLYSIPHFFSKESLLNIITKIIFNLHSHPSFGTQIITAKVSKFFSSYSQDMQFIIVATIAQSLLRVILVHLLVPRCLVPRRLVAFVRNKSSHLLSSAAYEWKPPTTSPMNATTAAPAVVGGGGGMVMPRRLSRTQEFMSYCSDKLTHTGLSFRRSLGHETEAVSTAASSPSSPSRRKSAFASSAPSSLGRTPLPPSQSSPPPSSYDYDKLDATQALRLFAAPRYATAVFRLLCCSLSCLWAITHFRKASFWPLWVGGSTDGHTKYCWDLSGTIDPSFVLKKDHHYQYQSQQYSYRTQENISSDYRQSHDSLFDLDFDNQNSALRYFFLLQVSYQLQSLCFHFLSMIVLVIYGGGSPNLNNGGSESSNNNNNDGGVVILSARSSFKSYLRPVVEHSLYLVLTITTFLFSALRRLGSISIFALELSSLALQFLQMCVNAPESSFLRKPRVVQAVHHYIAIPVFVYCRFFIIPFVVQYSAIFESTVWLRQIDHAFLPGCGLLIYCFFNGTLLLTLVLNFVYLRRLIFHPHVQDILK